MVAPIEAAVRHGEDSEPRQRNRTALVPEPALLELRLDRRRERPDRRVERRRGRQQEQRQYKCADHDPSIFARVSPTSVGAAEYHPPVTPRWSRSWFVGFYG